MVIHEIEASCSMKETVKIKITANKYLLEFPVLLSQHQEGHVNSIDQR